ncbi:MFS transporter [Actinoplanes sp. NPDC049548]|uniref:MFS transporter n=1 Tax=Actinoplanes sp. NPDC049548 TaxID=3155152 RepID=UPI00341F3B21
MSDVLRDADEPAILDRPPMNERGPLSPRYLAFVAGMGLSSLGDAAWYVALTWTLTRVSSPAVAGAVLALAGLPMLAALLAGGAVADRYGPRRVMVGTDLARCGAMLAAAGTVAVIGPVVPLLVAVAAVLSLLNAYFVPASGALRPQLLPSRHLVRGNAAYLLGLRGGQAAGGPIGAALVDVGGIALVACVNAVSFVGSAMAVLLSRPLAAATARLAPVAPAQRPPPEARPPFFAQVRAGLRYIARERRLRLLMVVAGLVELSNAGPLNIGVVLFARSAGTAASGTGLLLTAFTAGATVSFLATLILPARRRAAPRLVAGILTQGACLVTLGLAGSLSWGVAAYFITGVSSGFVGITLVSLVQRWSATELRGRVMSIQALVIFASVPLGNLAIGSLIEWFGVAVTMCAHAILSCAAVAIVLATPALRGARLD